MLYMTKKYNKYIKKASAGVDRGSFDIFEN